MTDRPTSRAALLPLPTPARARSPTARKMAAELRRHSIATPAPVKLQRAASSTPATAAPQELPVLRFHYVARDVKVCVGSAWTLHRFELKSIRLQTGEQPTLFVFSPGHGAKFPLPHDTTCELTAGNGLKLKGTALRVRLRFATAADAAIWQRLVQDALAHAAWLKDFEEVQCLCQDTKTRVVVARHRARPQEERVIKVLKGVRADEPEVLTLKKLVGVAHIHTPLAFLGDYRVVETQEDVQIIMPRHAGKTLLAFLSNGPNVLAENDARCVVEQICETLHALHANDIVHCDLKLENVLVTPGAKQAQVIDFGGAYDASLPNDQQPQRRMVGTPGYIAPERVLCVDEPPTAAADLFSLGIILYQILVGQHPFAEAQAARRHLTIQDSLKLDREHMQRRLRERNVSPEAQQLVAQLVAADPRKRASLRQVLGHAWFSNQTA